MRLRPPLKHVLGPSGQAEWAHNNTGATQSAVLNLDSSDDDEEAVALPVHIAKKEPHDTIVLDFPMSVFRILAHIRR